MGDWLSTDTTRYCAMGTVEQAQNSRGTTLITGGANTKGGYGELTQSTPFDISEMLIHVQAPIGASARALVDIARGTVGSEQVFIENIHVDSVNANVMVPFRFPIQIPRGDRISARAQGSGVGNSVGVSGLLVSGGFAELSSFGKVTTYGADTSDSGGTLIDPGGTAGVKGSWIPITISTTSPISRLLIAIGGDANGVRANTSWLVDLGIGPPGNEQIILNNMSLVFNDAYIYPKSIGPKSVSIPAATRIAIRAQCTNADATDRLFDVVLYGVS